MLTLGDFEQVIDPTILQRGRSYYADGDLVSLEEVEEGRWQAEVEGARFTRLDRCLAGSERRVGVRLSIRLGTDCGSGGDVVRAYGHGRCAAGATERADTRRAVAGRWTRSRSGTDTSCCLKSPWRIVSWRS